MFTVVLVIQCKSVYNIRKLLNITEIMNMLHLKSEGMISESPICYQMYLYFNTLTPETKVEFL